MATNTPRPHALSSSLDELVTIPSSLAAERRPDLASHLQRALQEHQQLFAQLHGLGGAIEQTAERIADTLRRGNKLLLCGNGGSAADAEHFAAELAGRFLHDRPALAAVALSGSGALLSCIGNDYGFEHVFARQVAALGVPGDCLVGLSTSGRSPNVLAAMREGRTRGLTTIGLTGQRAGNLLAEACDHVIAVPHTATARIQEAHGFIVHALCGLIEIQLGHG